MKPVFNGICSGPYNRAIGLGTLIGHGRLNLSHLDKFFLSIVKVLGELIDALSTVALEGSWEMTAF